jgi:pimeloyl-ACP methyl ester carboxylesterase
LLTLALLLAWLLPAAQEQAQGAVPAPGKPRAAALRVGSLTLHRCRTGAPWCGTLSRPLDSSGAVPGNVAVYFEYYPHSAASPAAGTLVAVEGGPGYPTTESRDEYLGLFRPLRDRYDVLLVDNRGTGRSGAIDCEVLQNAPGLTTADIGACGRSLGARAALYSIVPATEDLAALLEALGIPRIALYGNSSGTHFVQLFAQRHGTQLRAVILDAAYAADGADDAWAVYYAPAMRDKFNLACARAPACAALPGSSMQHIAPALAALRAQPFAARARSGDGSELAFTADASALAIVMFGSSPPYASVRETDAAARAFVAGDQVPLLRLMAETLGSVDSRDATRSPALFSAGAAAAIACHDEPQIFDMQLPPAQRARQRDALIAQRRGAAPDTYAPFTIDEYRRMPLDYSFIDQCVEWPALAAGAPPPMALAAGAKYPDVPVLVISGELDNMTPPAGAAKAAAHFAHAQHLIVANGFHDNAQPHSRSECGEVIARRFLDTLKIGDASCAREVPPVRLVPRFARRFADLDPASAAPGNQAGAGELRQVTAALLTAEDAIARARDNGAGHGAGLRGGTFIVATDGGGYRLELTEVRWTEDLAVSGRIDWPGRTGTVHAHLAVSSPSGPGVLDLSWPEGVAHSRAQASGRLAGQPVAAEAPAP